MTRVRSDIRSWRRQRVATTSRTETKQETETEPPTSSAALLARPRLEVADIFRRHGSAWRQANAGHVSLGQLKVMAAIENCRTAALGGHVARCGNDKCGHTEIAYNSCLMGKFRNGELAAVEKGRYGSAGAFFK